MTTGHLTIAAIFTAAAVAAAPPPPDNKAENRIVISQDSAAWNHWRELGYVSDLETIEETTRPTLNPTIERLIEAGSEAERKLYHPVRAVCSEQARELEQSALHANAELLELADALPELDSYNFKFDWHHPWDTLQPQLRYFRHVSRLNTLRAVLAIEQGQCAEAAKYLEQNLRLATWLTGTPNMLSQLVSRSISRSNIELLTLLLPKLSDASLERVRQELTRQFEATRNSYRRAHEYETVSNLLTLPGMVISEGVREMPEKYTAVFIAAQLASCQTALDRYLENVAFELAMFERPYFQIDRAELDRLGEIGDASASQGLGGEIFKMLSFSKLRWLKARAAHRGYLLASRTLISLEQYRRIHGDYPDSLAQLTEDFPDEPPVMPLTGAPPVYRKGRVSHEIFKAVPKPEEPDNLLDWEPGGEIEADGISLTIETSDGNMKLVVTE